MRRKRRAIGPDLEDWGPYKEWSEAQMKAYDRLPAKVRKALRNAVPNVDTIETVHSTEFYGTDYVVRRLTNHSRSFVAHGVKPLIPEE